MMRGGTTEKQDSSMVSECVGPRHSQVPGPTAGGLTAQAWQTQPWVCCSEQAAACSVKTMGLGMCHGFCRVYIIPKMSPYCACFKGSRKGEVVLTVGNIIERAI